MEGVFLLNMYVVYKCIVMIYLSFYNNLLQFLVINCGIPENGTNTVGAGSDYTYNNNVTYDCILGYEVQSGNALRTCQANGNWSGTPLICSGKYYILAYI